MTTPWLPTLPAGASAKQLQDAVHAEGLARVRSFPPDAPALIKFLAEIGTPLEYYGGDTGTHPDAAAIWRVRYEPAACARGEVHALDGPLAVHSSQSLLTPRPRYFCMLMVNPGWQDEPAGRNGESLLVAWADAFARMSEERGTDYGAALAALMSEVPYPGGELRSVAYALDDSRGEFDIGVRLKSGLAAHLCDTAPGKYSTTAVARFADTAQQVARTTQLDAGDLIVVDNDRWGHGRTSVVGRRRNGAADWMVNPRELWSLTVA